MYVRDLEGEEYLLQATSTNNLELNGNQNLTFKILSTKVNKQFINDISEMWEVVDNDDVPHKIIYFKKQGEGNSLSVNIKAIPLFFDDFNRSRIYEEYNEHMTAREFFDLVFNGTKYNYVLLDSFDAVQWQGLGAGSTRLEMFKNGLNRYKAEFRLQGNTVYLESLIGRDTNFMYRYRLNASNIVQENDGSELYTYARGYGNYEDTDGYEGAKLIREYISPLEKIIPRREAPPIMNGKITREDTMDSQLKTLVDESLKISVSADIHDLRKQNYPFAQPELGDRVFIIDERIGLHAETRVVNISITRDWKGNVIDLKLTFGSPSLIKRYQSNINTATKQITQVLEGRRKIPFSVLDNAVIQATKELQGVTSELTVPPNGGLMAVDKDDPNNLVLFNSAGIGISDDGGRTFKTAMTGSGIVADVITAGTLRGITVISDDGQGNTVTIENGSLVSKNNNRNMVEIHNYEVYFYDPGTDGPNPDYTEVGTIGAAWTSYERGLGIVGYKDFITLGNNIDGASHNRWMHMNFKDRYTTISGGDATHDTGRLYLFSTEEGGSAKGLIPSIQVLNYTDSESTSWSSVIISTGRDNRSPSSNNFRGGFEVWQYRGDGNGSRKLMLDIDTDSNGKTYLLSHVDEVWLGSNNDLYVLENEMGVDVPATFFKSLTVQGTKSAVVNTKSYGSRLMYAVESPDNRFMDIVQCELVEGEQWVKFNEMFAETINGYDVFVFNNKAEIEILEKEHSRFKVKSNIETDAAFLIYGRRIGFEEEYMKEVKNETENQNQKTRMFRTMNNNVKMTSRKSNLSVKKPYRSEKLWETSS